MLVLSQLPEVYDRSVMATLRRELQPVGNAEPYLLERVELPDETDIAKLRVAVQQAMKQRPWRLVVATTGQAAQLVAETGTRVPLLFRSSVHPVVSCLVHNLRHPGTGATGYTSATWSEGKMAEALQLAYPRLKQIVLLVDGRPDTYEADCPPTLPTPPCRAGFVHDPAEQAALLVSFTSLPDVLRIGRSPHPPVRVLRLCDPADVAALPRWLPANGAQAETALVVPYQPLFYESGTELIAKVRRLRLPAIFGSRNFLPMGALMAMAPLAEPPGEARGIELARRILAGESPAEIPVQRPEGVELIVNLSVARELGMPPSKALLRAADRLIR
ncbi:hypothetical protein LRH25_05570 [Ideonella azotifigens]|uniref:ABC transporter substrate binding protein n=1 Tax=Ideonella azotifigens TaxID=513160 RepID=UPI001477238F|nr:ABC transporter substrate binding protein [Ideonella azotifigens]MCD2339809.1 hypothetical protein [Ideonella azotifigens]